VRSQLHPLQHLDLGTQLKLYGFADVYARRELLSRRFAGASSSTTTLLEEVQVHYWKKCQFTITVAKAMVVTRWTM
jgi:hypothetical protein